MSKVSNMGISEHGKYYKSSGGKKEFRIHPRITCLWGELEVRQVSHQSGCWETSEMGMTDSSTLLWPISWKCKAGVNPRENLQEERKLPLVDIGYLLSGKEKTGKSNNYKENSCKDKMIC